MVIIKEYTAIKLSTKTVDEEVRVKLTFGQIEGSYYSRYHPEETFETEEKAIEYAHKKDKWGRWLILPLITFDNY